jgi:hypothetical protein
MKYLMFSLALAGVTKSSQIYLYKTPNLNITTSEDSICSDNKNSQPIRTIKSIELETLQESISYIIDQIRAFKYSNHDTFLS